MQKWCRPGYGSFGSGANLCFPGDELLTPVHSSRYYSVHIFYYTCEIEVEQSIFIWKMAGSVPALPATLLLVVEFSCYSVRQQSCHQCVNMCAWVEGTVTVRHFESSNKL